MNRKSAQIAKILLLALPIIFIFLPVFYRLRFIVFKVEAIILLLGYLYYSQKYLSNKQQFVFPQNLPYFLNREVFFTSLLASTSITIWFYFEGFFGIDLINWFNSTISLPVFNNIFIHPENLLTKQIGFFVISFILFLFLYFINFGVFSLDKTINKKRFLKNKKLSIYLSLLSILTCAFSSELFQNTAGSTSLIFYGGTEDYIRYRIRNALTFTEDLKKYGGFIYGFFPKESGSIFVVYLSNTGFWGSVLKFFQTTFHIDPELFLIGTRIALSMIYSNILLWIGYKLKKNFGFIAAVLFILPQVFTFWILGPVKHIIWFYPLLFAPFLHSLIRYPKVLSKEISAKRFLIEELFIFILVFLRGYTYLSNIILSAMVPVIYYELQNNSKIKQVIKKLIPIGVAGGASLLIVIGLHLVQLTLFMGSIYEAALYFSQRTAQRTGFQDPISYWQLFKNWWNVLFFHFPLSPQYYISYWEKIGDVFTIGTVHYIYALLLMTSVYLKYKSGKIKNNHLTAKINMLYDIGIATLFSMFASWSWFINKGHMAPHYNMNGIMYIVPFGFSLFIFFGVFVQTLIQYFNYFSNHTHSEG